MNSVRGVRDLFVEVGAGQGVLVGDGAVSAGGFGVGSGAGDVGGPMGLPPL